MFLEMEMGTFSVALLELAPRTVRLASPQLTFLINKLPHMRNSRESDHEQLRIILGSCLCLILRAREKRLTVIGWQL